MFYLYLQEEKQQMFFYSYHKSETENYLNSGHIKYIGDLESTKFPIFTKKTQFYPSLKKEVEKHIKETKNNSRSVTPLVFLNTVFILGGMIISYYFSMYSNFNLLTKIFFSILAGIFHHLSMVHIWHDVSHFCYSSYPFVWRYMGYFGEFLTGHSMYIWTHRHTVTHHIYTNVSGIDPDIGIYKCNPNESENGFKFRLREFILPTVLQPYMYFFVVIQMQIDDFTSFRRKSMENTIINDTGYFQTFVFYTNKYLFFIHRILLPILFFNQPIFQILILFSITELIAGVLFGYFSQITHVQEDVLWPNSFFINEDWAELQVQTAIDYCQDSYFWTYISGNLNYQVVHHLFPSVAPHKYHFINEIVLKKIKEFNLKYKVMNSIDGVIDGHFNHLSQFQKLRNKNGKYDHLTNYQVLKNYLYLFVKFFSWR